MQEIQGAFSKGLMYGKGRNKIPAEFAGRIENCRIKNRALVNKKGAELLYTFTYRVQAMLWYEVDNKLLVVSNGVLYENTTSIGSVGGYTGTNEYTMVAHGDFVLIFNGQEPFWVYHTTHGLYQTSDAGGYNAGSGILPPGLTDGSTLQDPDPMFGEVITGFTLIAGTNTITNKILYISKPVTPSTPYVCYDFSVGAGQDYDVGENRYLNSKILGIQKAGENAYVFCERSIELIGRKTVEVSGGIASFSTVSIESTDQLAHHNLSCAVGDMVFYYTKSKRIMSINYTPGVANPQINEDLSEPINDWLSMNMDSSQDAGFAFYDKYEKHVEFHLQTNQSSPDTPDVVVIYDLRSQSFIIDTDIAFHYLTSGGSTGDKTYGAFGKYVYIDNSTSSGFDNATDDTSGVAQAITASYHTTNIAMGNIAKEKMFNGFMVGGQVGSTAQLSFECFIDGVSVYTKTVEQADIADSELDAIDTGDPTSYATSLKLWPLELVADYGEIRRKGKRIRISFECATAGGKFALDTLAIGAIPTGNYELNDKF